ncbi:MAG: L,D-transpeptidase [Actinomycetota bacterium]
MRVRSALWITVVALVLAGCRSAVPVSVHAAAETSPSPSAVPSVSAETEAPRPVQVVRTSQDMFLVYAEPATGAPEQLASTNDWFQPLALPVLDRRRVDGERWFRVRLPIRPNGSTGWLRADDVRVRALHERIVVDLSEHVLRRIRDGEVVQRFRIGIGTPTYPTTPGRFFVWARLRFDPPGVYGVGALGLSGFSDVITDWAGGGRMAIHGTGDPTNRGRDVSHGCVRVYDPQMARLTDVALGTPVWIRP